MIVTCRELTEMATDQKEGALPLVDRAGVRVHLAWCKRCRTYLRQMDMVIDALHAVPKDAVPDGVHDALRARFERKHNK